MRLREDVRPVREREERESFVNVLNQLQNVHRYVMLLARKNVLDKTLLNVAT